MPRLFIAVELPEEVKKALGRLQIDLRGGRWVPRDQLHLTLAFLGNQEDALVGRLHEALTVLREAAFTLHLSSCGAFPDSRRPRVIWAGIQPEQRLKHLAMRVQDVVAGCGVQLEERPFAPHITLARFKGPTDGVAVSGWIRGASNAVKQTMPVREFVLFESRLTAGGAIHTPLARFPLTVKVDSPSHTLPTGAR